MKNLLRSTGLGLGLGLAATFIVNQTSENGSLVGIVLGYALVLVFTVSIFLLLVVQEDWGAFTSNFAVAAVVTIILTVLSGPIRAILVEGVEWVAHHPGEMLGGMSKAANLAMALVVLAAAGFMVVYGTFVAAFWVVTWVTSRKYRTMAPTAEDSTFRTWGEIFQHCPLDAVVVKKIFMPYDLPIVGGHDIRIMRQGTLQGIEEGKGWRFYHPAFGRLGRHFLCYDWGATPSGNRLEVWVIGGGR